MKEQFSPEKLWSVRIRAGLSVKDLADRSGMRPKTISKFESGARRPNLATEMVLAEALGVPLRTLYTPRSSG